MLITRSHQVMFLQITVWKEEGLDQEVLVLPDGTLSYPLIGSLDVNGQTPCRGSGRYQG